MPCPGDESAISSAKESTRRDANKPPRATVGSFGREQSHGARPTLQTRGEKRARSGSVEILLELMANGADSDNVATHFKCGNEPGASEGNDEFTLLVVQGASGLAA